MRVLTLCYEYPPIGGGGGRVAQTVGRALVARGHEVRVQTAALGWRSRRELDEGVEIFRTASGRHAPDTCTVREMAAYCATSLAPALGHVWRWRPQVIHAHFAVPTGALAWLVSRMTGVPYVLTAHLGDVPGGVPEQTDRLFRWIGPAARMIWSGAAGATAVSSFVKELAERAYTRRVERIVNGIALHGRPPAPHTTGTHMVFVGRFNPQKRPLFLIEALARLATPGWHLTMIGDGPLRAEVERAVAAHGLGGRVTLRGWLEGSEVQRVLSTADILTMPSDSEGLPVAGVEGLKHGLAIAACAIPGLADVVEPGSNGFSTPVPDAAAYARELDALLADPARLLDWRRRSWEKAAEFEIGHIAAQYERVLQTALPAG